MKKISILALCAMLLSCTQRSDNPEMILVQGGTFTMGDTCCHSNRQPLRTVAIEDFSIGKHELTVAQFAQFVGETNYITDAEKDGGSTILQGTEWKTVDTVNWRHDSKGSVNTCSDCPVIHISWNDAVAYCEWLSSTTGNSYRLPTEAEWEYAARGGVKSTGTIFSGSDSINKVAWYLGNVDVEIGVRKVGQKVPNQLGIYDMTGNVWEWCSDFYAKNYNPLKSEISERRVNRGGSWYTPAVTQSHLTHRSSLKPNKQGNLLGLRVACTDCQK
ncbi:MAG: formylglycine-generating enzyme family protein [Prevotellaceae bacterium]|jgi:formylglycine-generating enzyme required for sulfatase activity|nr:formylglycine-generating enzyme family protein [Prevotellaceae bacterium]